MSSAVFTRSRMVSLSLVAALILGAATAFAQDAPSNTAATRDGAPPILIGNNAGRAGGGTVLSSGTQSGVAPIVITTPRASTKGGTNKFKELMDSVNSTMSSNANAAAAEREKKIAEQAAADDAAARRKMARDPNAQQLPSNNGTVIMRDAEPNDINTRPSHTFTIQ